MEVNIIRYVSYFLFTIAILKPMLKFLLLSIWCIDLIHCLPGYRLPEDVKPHNYQLTVLADIDEPNFKFNGSVLIKVECINPTNTIILHSKNLTITDKDVEVSELAVESDEQPIKINIIQQRFVPENDYYVMKLDKNLKVGKNYTVNIPFKGIINQQLVGFYRSKYVEKKTNQTRWLGVTQFESTYARQAFPCFDEPAMKAIFKIKLGHNKKFKSISNMPLINTTPVNDMNEWVWSEFEETVPMSTYLVAYVIGDFLYEEAPMQDNNVTFRIWSRKEALNQVEFAKYVGPKVLKFYEEYFKIKYPLPKQDMIAIPDFSAGAMENWGLITYRETDLLFGQNFSSIANKQRIASVIAHELAHQWFGNLVTMKWWTDLWLNEGFATYIGSIGVNQIFPDWNHLEEDALDNSELVFELDSLKSSHPVSLVIGNPNEIPQIFDIISYKKGALIIRMMHKFLGKSFEDGVTDYLQKHKYSNAEKDDLWEALTQRAHKDNTLSPDMNVKDIMDTWTLQTGYPVVNVMREYEQGTVNLSQQRYLKLIPEGKDNVQNNCWWVPITYTSQSVRNFNSTVVHQWLKCGQELQLKDVVKPDEWIIFNVDLAGVYRVNYDDKNWQMIIATLNSDNYNQIGSLNRATLLIDVFDFAWRGDIDYNRAFEVLSYLKRETDYLPFDVGLGKLHSIGAMLKRTPAYGNYRKFVQKLIDPIYQRYNQLLKIPNKRNELRLHILLNKWACTFNVGTCRQQANEIFNKWRSMTDPDQNNPIPTNVRSIIYCIVVKFGDTDTWDFLWKRYRSSNNGNEKNNILNSLGCSRDIWVLNRYLDWSIDDKSLIRKQDSSLTFGAIAAHSVGFYVACDFLQSKLNDIYKFHLGRDNTIGKYLNACAKNLIFEEETIKWASFISKNKDMLKGSKLVADQSLETVVANSEWYNKHYKNVLKVLSSTQ